MKVEKVETLVEPIAEKVKLTMVKKKPGPKPKPKCVVVETPPPLPPGVVRKAEVFLEFQDYIDYAPQSPKALFQAAASNDDVTIAHWRDIWIRNVRENKKRFGSFAEHSVGKLHGFMKNAPCIIAGSGPSLKVNAGQFKSRGRIGLLSCLHNFHFLEDLDASVDFYVSLDAGPIVIDEVFEGGKHGEDYYWAKTKDKKLIAFIGTDPKLFEKWQGEVYLYAASVPDDVYQKTVHEIEPFDINISNGGNVLGACLYIAKAIMGANPIIFTGADFAFGYDKKFHSWDSKYDANMGYALKKTDVFGNKIYTWLSYYNFKCWFDSRCLDVPGIWINATEGGLLGAYDQGNLRCIKQMKLADVFEMYNMSEHPAILKQVQSPHEANNALLF